MNANPVDKQAMARDLKPLRNLFGKSVVTRCELSAGTILQPEHLTLKKPGTGIPATRLAELIHRQLKRALPANSILQEEDLN
jgi:N-acetylneuraminate synthase